MPRKIEISHRTIIFTVLLVISLWVLLQIADIILMLFISVILMSATKPTIDRLEELHIPRGLSILILYLLLWVVIGFVLAGLIPGLIDQTTKLIKILPDAIGNIQFLSDHQQDITQQLVERLGALPTAILKFVFDMFGNLLSVLTTTVVTFYLLLERKKLNTHLESLLEDIPHERIVRIIDTVELRLGHWVRGELVLMLAVGTFTYIGLLILGIEMALPLAILAGLLELIPNVGPIISSVPAILIALMVSPLTGLATAALYLLVQFLENHLLVPKIMQKAVGVSPLVSIISLMIGFRLAGSIGAILAIPTILVIESVGRELLRLSRNKD